MRSRSTSNLLLTLLIATANPAAADEALQGFIEQDGTHRFRIVLPAKLRGADWTIAQSLDMDAEEYRDYRISTAMYNARWCIHGWSIDAIEVEGGLQVIDGTCRPDPLLHRLPIR